MRLACPHCQAGYDFPVELIAGPDLALRCAACFGPFEVGREGVRPPPRSAVPEADAVARALIEALDAETSPEAEADDVPPPGPARQTERTVPDADAAGGFYMVLRGGRVSEAAPRRRVALVPRTQNRAPPQARLVSVNANFGRPARVRLRPLAVVEVPVERLEAEATSVVAPTVPAVRGRAILFGAAALVLATVGTTLVALAPAPEAPAIPGAPATTVSSAAAPVASAPPTAEARLVAEVTAIEPLPDQHAILLHGHVFNGTPDPQTAVLLRAELLVDGVVERRREAWCCQEFSATETVALLADPKRLRISPRPEPGRVTTVEPNTDEAFTIVFPGADPAAFAPTALTAEVRMTEALRLRPN